MLTKDARIIWNSLSGIINVYKPADVTCKQVQQTIMTKICTELNEMKSRPSRRLTTTEENAPGELTLISISNLCDHPLVAGPRYQQNDLRCTWSSYLGTHTSGVLLLGLKQGTKTAMLLRTNKLTRAYRIKGMLGQATDTFYKDGRVVERSTFKFIKYSHMDRLLSSMQTAHQRKMFELCGVDIQSQAAYDLAIKGPIRPVNSKIPLIYGIKCMQFEPPYFTIEVQCINEYEVYLKTLIHEIGMKLHSTAHCTSIQCIRHSYFTLEDALLRKHWTLQNIVTNMEKCNEILTDHENLTERQTIALQ